MGSQTKSLGVVIVGGNGFLGSHLARSLRKRARVALTHASNRVPIEGVLSLPIDARDGNGMKRILYAQRPDVVVYMAGSEGQEWVDRDAKAAEKIVSSAAGEVLHASEILSARFVYVSSSAVFDGSRGNYKESDPPSALSTFGKMKAAAENLVRGRAVNAAVLRLSPLVGSAHPWRPSLFDRLRSSLAAGERVDLLDDEWHSWAPVSGAVTAIEAVMERAPRNALFHYGGLTRLTPFEMGRLFAERMGYDPDLVQPKKRPVQKGTAALPDGHRLDWSLNSSEIIRALGLRVAPIEDSFEAEFAFD